MRKTLKICTTLIKYDGAVYIYIYIYILYYIYIYVYIILYYASICGHLQVVLETLRLYPPFFGQLKYLPSKCKLANLSIPGGTNVMVRIIITTWKKLNLVTA